MRGCRKLTQEEINTKLENHKLWLEDNARGEQADFSNVDFTGVDCAEADFTEAICKAADFTGCFLGYVNFTGANCSYADFTDANCSYAKFTGANCSNANFSEAICCEANLRKADFTGVNFTNTKGAIIDGKTLESDHLQEQTDEVIA